MPKSVLILDTTVICCLLRVPDKDTCGPKDDAWNYDRISELLKKEEEKGNTFVLPLAALIETGNHITHSSSANKRNLAIALCELLKRSVNGNSPWATFIEQSSLWEADQLTELSNTWPDLAMSGISIGDATIKQVAEYYAKAGMNVEILTGDQGLKAYQPSVPAPRPRRLGG